MIARNSPFFLTDPRITGNSMPGIEISPESYVQFQEFLSSRSGIRLGDNKRYLVTNRLAGICRNSGIESLDELIKNLIKGSLTHSLVTEIIDAMTTNETFWFRDVAQFQELQQIVFPELSKNRMMTTRIWSAGCSSGQEAYSIGIAIDRYNRNNPTKALSNVQIVGTDISESILRRARNGRFSDLELSRGLDMESRSRYFVNSNGGWEFDKKISSKVQFQFLNLQQSFSSLGQFELIFCRNVLIYFSDELKKDILTRMVKALKPSGYLFLSSTETIPNGLEQHLDLVKGRTVRYYRMT